MEAAVDKCEKCSKRHAPDLPCLRGVVLVCGGRSYGVAPPEATPEEREKSRMEREFLWDTLTNVAERMKITEIRHGNAYGADTLAGQWARLTEITAGMDKIAENAVPADWKRLGKAAGPARNAKMLEMEPKPVVCIAFPGGSGTADMGSRCQKAGIRVWKPAQD